MLLALADRTAGKRGRGRRVVVGIQRLWPAADCSWNAAARPPIRAGCIDQFWNYSCAGGDSRRVPTMDEFFSHTSAS